MSECGAKTRAGGTCKRKPMENGRCHYHGGKSTGPPKNNQNARKHGFYSSVLRDEEKEDYGTAKIEDALAMAYIQHKRALNAERDDLAEKMLGRIAQLEKTKAELGDTKDTSEDWSVIGKALAGAMGAFETSSGTDQTDDGEETV